MNSECKPDMALKPSLDVPSVDVSTANAYCRQLVQTYDKDRFLIALCYPEGKRQVLWPLLAFNHEIAKTREVVSDPTLGLIRLQWWRDALESLYLDRAPAGHEVLTALAAVIRAHQLPPADFHALIDARERDMDSAPFETLADLKAYGAETAVPLARLVLRVFGEKATESDLHAIATAYAVTGLLRAAPFQATQGRAVLPLDYEDEQTAVAAIVAAMTDLCAQVPRRLPSAYLRRTRALTRTYLARMRRCGYMLHDPRMQAPPLGFIVRAFLGLRV